MRARPAMGKVTVTALGCIFSLATVLVPASRAGAIGVELRRMDASLPALPLSGTFEKEDGDNGPFGLTLKNTSGNSVKAGGIVLLNMGSDAHGKTKEIPEHIVARAESWTIYGLSTGDTVTIEADGFAALVLKVP